MVYAAAARTFDGSLAEMERLIGPSLYGGYVGYNGRQLGSRKALTEAEEHSAVTAASSGDARHTLVAYFQIRELAALCGIPKPVSDLAIRCFRHAASKINLRNRNVESLATASLVCALHRTRFRKDEISSAVLKDAAWKAEMEEITVEHIAEVSNIPLKEILRYLQMINNSLRPSPLPTSRPPGVHIPSLGEKLDLPQSTMELAQTITAQAHAKNLCSKRNPQSIAAAAIYMACQIEDRKKTQIEISKASGLTEVTLRKVHKELTTNLHDMIPDEITRKSRNEKVEEAVLIPVSGDGQCDTTHVEDEHKKNPTALMSPTFWPPPPPPPLPDNNEQSGSNAGESRMPPVTNEQSRSNAGESRMPLVPLAPSVPPQALHAVFLQYAMSGLLPSGPPPPPPPPPLPPTTPPPPTPPPPPSPPPPPTPPPPLTPPPPAPMAARQSQSEDESL